MTVTKPYSIPRAEQRFFQFNPNAAIAYPSGPEGFFKDMAFGVVEIKGPRVSPFEVKYDEMLYIVSGRFDVEYEGNVIHAAPGDVLGMPKGALLVYRYHEDVKMVLAISGGDAVAAVARYEAAGTTVRVGAKG